MFWLLAGADASRLSESNKKKLKDTNKRNLLRNHPEAKGAPTARWCWSRGWKEGSVGQSSHSFSATSISHEYHDDDDDDDDNDDDDDDDELAYQVTTFLLQVFLKDYHEYCDV